MSNTKSQQASNFNLYSLSENRNVIYGIMILWIMFFHSTLEYNSAAWKMVSVVKELGNIGVDVFLLLSGISLFFSFSKNERTVSFYKRRLNRILYPFFIVQIPYCLLMAVAAHLSWTDFLLDLTGFSLFTNGTRTVWFITVILFCYLIYPFVYKFFKRFRWKIGYLIGLICVDLLINYLLARCFPVFWGYSEILFRRIPVFITGTFLGKYVKDQCDVKARSWVVLLLCVVAIAVYEVILHRFQLGYIFLRYAYLPISVLLACSLSLLGKIKFLQKFFLFLGKYTLEIYLTHEKLILVFERVFARCGLGDNLFLINVAAAGFAVLAAVIISKIVHYLQTRLKSVSMQGK